MSIETGAHSSRPDHLLHPEAFERASVVGRQYRELLTERAAEIHEATADTTDPDVSVLIRTRNHAHRLEDLFADIDAQHFDGNVQAIVVDTESTDSTTAIARAYGATVVPITQHDFNYPHSLNVGFEAADHPNILTLVGHSRLSNNQTLRSVTRWADKPDFAGAYGAALPDMNARIGDIAIALLQKTADRLQPAIELDEWQPGAMVAHRSVVSKDAWRELGGYDPAYGNGGEDTDMARRMLEAGGIVIREPGLSVHHSYGLGILDTMRHIAKLRKLRTAGPTAFEQGSVRHLNK